MGEILFISHRIPFPPDRGDKIRSHNVLKALARLAPVHVATFADDALDLDHEQVLATVAASYRLVRRTKPLPVAGVESLARRQPVSLAAFRHTALARYVSRVLATRPISAIYVFSGQMGQYVPKSFKGRVIVDFVDVDSAKFEAYAQDRSGIMALVQAREARLLRAEEARLASRTDVSVLVSEAETALFVSRLPDGVQAVCDVRTLPNGIDSIAFDPAQVVPESAMLACDGPRLILTGQMDYAPNIAAADRIISRILPLVRAEIPSATFHLVGRNPPQRLARMHGKAGCYVWGRVPDIRNWLKAADLALVPLEIARGVQNKVLEAMSMALPVVLSPQAAEGIDGRDGCDFKVAASDEQLAAACVSLLRDPVHSEAMGSAARRYVQDNASWQAALAPLPKLLGIARGAALDAA